MNSQIFKNSLQFELRNRSRQQVFCPENRLTMPAKLSRRFPHLSASLPEKSLDLEHGFVASIFILLQQTEVFAVFSLRLEARILRERGESFSQSRQNNCRLVKSV
jgi:hypothetical protein